MFHDTETVETASFSDGMKHNSMFGTIYSLFFHKK